MHDTISLKQLIQQIFSDIFESSGYKQAEIEKHFHPDYQQHVDGKVLNFESFSAHIKALKDVIVSTKVHFEHILEEGNRVSTIHHIEARKKDGSEVKAYVMAYFEFEGDQLILCKELTRITQGSKEDADLGSRH